MGKSDNISILRDAVARYGQPEQMTNFLSRIMHAESNGDARAKNTESTATGLFQFINSTWKQYGRGGDIYSPAAQSDAVVRFTMDNAKVLQAVLGRAPDEGEYYLAHFAGAEGARKVLTAAPSDSIRSLLGEGVMKANAQIKFRGKKFADFTASDLQEWADARMSVDMDARQQYGQRRSAGKTTAEEDAQELAVRRRNLESFGLDKAMLDKLGPFAILGEIFMGIIKYLMEESAPASERSSTVQASRTPQVAMQSVQQVQAAAVAQNRRG